jgi:cysteine desulfuration protein SufE
MPIPSKLQEFLETLEMVPDRADRIQYLISLAENFSQPGVPKPYPETARVPGCESEAFLFVTPRADGTLDFRFAVENPQGVSAMAFGNILSETLSGAPLEQIAEVSDELVFNVFGRELSMGKSMGLMGMLRMAKQAAINSRI